MLAINLKENPLASFLPLCVLLDGWSQPGPGQILDISYPGQPQVREGSGSEVETWVLGEVIAGCRAKCFSIGLLQVFN